METKPAVYLAYGQEELDHLHRADPVLGAAINRIGRIERPVNPDMFTALVNAIVSQLISVKAALTIYGRLEQLCGTITPANLAVKSLDELRSCGVSMKKAAYIQQIAILIMEGSLRLDELSISSDAEVIAELTKLNGVGVWTVEMLLIFSMGRRDVVSWGDLAIRRGMMKLYGMESLTKKQFDQLRESYSPYGSVASLYLWAISND